MFPHMCVGVLFVLHVAPVVCVGSVDVLSCPIYAWGGGGASVGV